MALNHKVFFDTVRGSLFRGRLSPEQVLGMSTILNEWQIRRPNGDHRHLAYMLSTTKGETGNMLPVEEGYYLGAKAKAFQRRLRYYPFFGRGLVQLTWEANYRKASKESKRWVAGGVDFVKNPDLLLLPIHAVNIMILGMEEGWFTGKKLSQFFNATKSDPFNARTIINGHDRAGEFAGMYDRFLIAIKKAAAAAKDIPMTTPVPVPLPDPKPPIETNRERGIWFFLAGIVAEIIVAQFPGLATHQNLIVQIIAQYGPDLLLYGGPLLTFYGLRTAKAPIAGTPMAKIWEQAKVHLQVGEDIRQEVLSDQVAGRHSGVEPIVQTPQGPAFFGHDANLLNVFETAAFREVAKYGPTILALLVNAGIKPAQGDPPEMPRARAYLPPAAQEQTDMRDPVR